MQKQRVSEISDAGCFYILSLSGQHYAIQDCTSTQIRQSDICS